MSVTSIRNIVNQSEFPVVFLKLENTEDHGIIYPGQVNYNEVWIPWCDNAVDFSRKVLILEVNGDMRFYIWQSGPGVYYHQAPVKAFSTGQPYASIAKPPQLIPYVAVNPQLYKGQLIPGVSAVGGNRRLTIMRTYKPNAVLNQYFTINLSML